MTPILSSLAAGYGEEKVLSYLRNAFPNLEPKIKKAAKHGMSAASILNFLSKSMQGEEYDPNLSQSEARGRRKHKQEQITKNLLKFGATAIGGQFALNAALESAPIKGLLGKLKGKPIGPQPMGGAPVQPASPAPLMGQPQQGAPNAQQAPIPTQAAPLSPEGLQRKGMIDKLSSATPEFKEWANAKIEAGEDKPLDEMLKDFAREQAKKPKGMIQGIQEDIQKMEDPNAKVPTQEVPQTEKEIDIRKSVSAEEWLKQMRGIKPEKGSLVSTPSGEVGTVKDMKEKEALVDEDGKIHKVKLSDLQLPNEKIQKTVARLLEIPEIDKSSLINYWAYDPEDKQLIAMYHNGETYKYLDVPEELESQLLEADTTPKTEGENIFGAWSQEDQISRGATLSKLFLQHPKYKRAEKGKPKNPFYRKLRKGYDYWSKLRQ